MTTGCSGQTGADMNLGQTLQAADLRESTSAI
jgi:hypothetical protein